MYYIFNEMKIYNHMQDTLKQLLITLYASLRLRVQILRCTLLLNIKIGEQIVKGFRHWGVYTLFNPAGHYIYAALNICFC